MSYALKALFLASILILSGSILPLTYAQNATSTLSPLKQLEGGISAHDVKCKQGLVLVIKTSDSSPVCVKPQTAQKLVERGWGALQEPTIWFEFSPVLCRPTPWEINYTNFNMSESNEYGKIKNYFNDQAIALFEVKVSYFPTQGVPVCGYSLGKVYHFLISTEDTSEMTNLGFKLSTEGLPLNASPLQ